MKLPHILLGAALLIAGISTSIAQTWPDKPVKLIVPYPAGGGVDPVARLLGQKLAERWKVPVLVENKPGASGSIGAGYVAQSPADGNTILMSATAEVVINQFIMKKMAYNPETDLRPVTQAIRLPFILVTHPSRPYSNMTELVAYARKNPGKVTYASSGNGTPQHLAGALLEQLAGVKMTHVPYKGVAPAVSDLLAGHVDIGFAGLPTGLPHVQAGKLRALGVSSRTSSPAAPQVPPVAAAPGLEKFELIQWFGVFVPRATPDTVVVRLQKDMADVLKMADVKEALEKQGAQPSGIPTAEFEALVK
ncbi:MAG: tripartite tricarboxylate transporter substrate binding protein, partial [Lacisediminimonas sp.]|nr:tripartite tricarboxylate transporter substrate binding protein [Lacisediminimonas sp.]